MPGSSRRWAGAQPDPLLGPDHVVRSRGLIGRRAYDRAGQPLGRVVDVVIEGDGAVPDRVTGVLVTTGPWGRLLGYASPDERGPWLVSRLAHLIIRRRLRTLAWDEVELRDR